MLNYNTIISSFDDKGTLLKWLKTIEKSLQGASLSSLELITVDEIHIRFKFIFADNSSVISPIVTLPRGLQGERGPRGLTGAKGEDGANFKIIGTVDSVAELPSTALAGDAFFVGTEPPRQVYAYDALTHSWVNEGYLQATILLQELEGYLEGSEHIIVEPNEEGTKIVFELDSELLEVINGKQDALTFDDEPTEDSSNPVKSGGVFDALALKQNEINDSEEIVKGDNDELLLHNDISNKINRALLLPITAPSSLKIVGIGTNNAEVLLDADEHENIFVVTSSLVDFPVKFAERRNKVLYVSLVGVFGSVTSSNKTICSIALDNDTINKLIPYFSNIIDDQLACVTKNGQTQHARIQFTKENNNLVVSFNAEEGSTIDFFSIKTFFVL